MALEDKVTIIPKQNKQILPQPTENNSIQFNSLFSENKLFEIKMVFLIIF